MAVESIIETVIDVERIMLPSEDVDLFDIINSITHLGDGLNVINMLQISTYLDDKGAQSSYLSIIEECSKVFKKDRFVVASLRKSFSDFSLVYYLEFIIASMQKDDEVDYLEGVIIPPDDTQLRALAEKLRERMEGLD